MENITPEIIRVIGMYIILPICFFGFIMYLSYKNANNE